MTRTPISSPRNWVSGRPYSSAIEVAGWLLVSGHVPVDRDGATAGSDTYEQTLAVLENLGNTLAAGGLTLDDLVSTTVYLTRIGDIGELDRAYTETFSGVLPTRTTVEISALGRKEFQVEISGVAVGTSRGSENARNDG